MHLFFFCFSFPIWWLTVLLIPAAQRNGPFSTNFRGEVIDVFPPRTEKPTFNEAIPVVSLSFFLSLVTFSGFFFSFLFFCKWSTFPTLFRSQFCQPTGWKVTKETFQPTFFCFVLTDFLGKKMYAACMNIPEKHPYVSIKKHFELERILSTLPNALHSPRELFPNSPRGPRLEDPSSLQDSDIIYAPKTMVILSDYPYYTTFRSCLCALYDIYLRGSPISFNRYAIFSCSSQKKEKEVTLRPCLQLGFFPHNGDPVASTWEGGRQVWSWRHWDFHLPPILANLSSCWCELFPSHLRQKEDSLLMMKIAVSVGEIFSHSWDWPYFATDRELAVRAQAAVCITSSLTAGASSREVSACLYLWKTAGLAQWSDFCDSSLSCSLSTLIYPFTFPHTYIPILPYLMLEGIEAPTPFIMGIHESLFDTLQQESDLSDVTHGFIFYFKNFFIFYF